MKYHCEKCNIHFDYPKRANNGELLCPQCGAIATPNTDEPDSSLPTTSPWSNIAKFILGTNIVGAIILVVSGSSEGISWTLLGGAVTEVAFVALLCGIVIQLADIHTTLKTMASSNLKK